MAADRMFGIPRYSQTIEGLVKERDINVKLTTNLVGGAGWVDRVDGWQWPIR
jgi:hypothetical protein